MIASQDFAERPPFSLQLPDSQRVPFVFNSPHSGSDYPRRFMAMTRLDAATVRRSEDCYVDELFAAAVAAGAPLMTAHFPRAYLDVNREPWELDPRMFKEALPSFANTRSARVAGGLGTVPRLVGEGQEIYGARLPIAEALERIERIYRPYHGELAALVAGTRRHFGVAVLVDCHSMPSSVRIGDERIRPDIIVGDRFGMSCAAAIAEAAIDLLSARGFTVAHNRPYAGGFITENYGRPARGVHAIQIEVSRGLYMNEHTLEKSSGFDELCRELAGFVHDFVRILPSADDVPLAAE